MACRTRNKDLQYDLYHVPTGDMILYSVLLILHYVKLYFHIQSSKSDFLRIPSTEVANIEL